VHNCPGGIWSAEIVKTPEREHRRGFPLISPKGRRANQAAARISREVLELHVALGDHDLEGVAVPSKPDRRHVGAAVFAVGRQDGGRCSVEQRTDVLGPLIRDDVNLSRCQATFPNTGAAKDADPRSTQ